MPIRFKCGCGTTLTVKDELTGKKVKCPKCTNIANVPGAAVAKHGGRTPSKKPGKMCTFCREIVPETITICPNCGMNFKTGHREEEKERAAFGWGSSSAKKLYAILGGIILLGLLAITSWAGRIFILCVAVFAAKGVWRGAVKQIAGIVGLILAYFLASPLGGALEGTLASILPVPAVINHFLSVGIAAIFVILVVEVAGALIMRRFMHEDEHSEFSNQLGGLGIGILEGILVAFVIFWSVMILEGPARANIESTVTVKAGRSYQVARAVLAISEDIEVSPVGRAALAVNPLSGTDAVSLFSEFVAIAQDDEALRIFTDDPAMQDLLNSGEIQKTLEKLQQDKALMADIESGKFRKVLDSAAVLEMLENDALLKEIKQKKSAILDAMNRAKEYLNKKSNTSEKPPASKADNTQN